MAHKQYTGRDAALVRLLQGATKAGVHRDRKRERSRRACRKSLDPDRRQEDTTPDKEE